MHPCPGNWVAIGCVVMYHAGLPTHLVQELNVSTVSVPPEYTITHMCSEHIWFSDRNANVL